MFFSTVAIAAFAGLAAAAPVKRGFGGRATYYATGLGACGQVSSDSDFIVALNTPQYGGGYPGPNCFKQIQISANGKTATATIMDQCPGCGYGDLDMSPSLFNHFADPSVGVFQMSWDFVGAAPAPAPEPTSTYVAPAPTSTYTPPAPTSTWVAPAPTSTWVAPTTTAEKETPSSTWVAPSSSSVPVEVKVESTSSAQPSSSSSVWSESSSSVAAVPTTSATSSVESTSATSTSSAPVPTITIDLGNGNLAELCEAVARMGKLVVVGASLANGTAVNIANTTLTLE
ncbi:hypothetical protein QFC24_003088 [Naganishia onofrii]|uniref:Uncharacterized protein n=1 Tax=Naganishia onofrii TaxID=1851511 RepID=A0ACC2XL09_9TREE|nr:hypothetical protein QFC24_003088 [Naganishia onofrii]